MQNVHDYNYRLLPRTTVEKPDPGIAPEPPHDWTGWENRLRHSSMNEEDRERRLTKLARLERAVRVHHIPLGYNPALERNDLGLRYLDMGDMPRAFRQLRGAVSQDPTMAMLHNNIGAMYLEIGDLERAGHYLSQAVLHQEDLDTAYGNRALVHIEQGQYLEAYQDLAVAIRLAPGDPAHHNNMGVLSLEAGFPETALACFMSAIQLDPTSPMYHSNLGFAHRESGNPAEPPGTSRVPAGWRKSSFKKPYVAAPRERDSAGAIPSSPIPTNADPHGGRQQRTPHHSRQPGRDCHWMVKLWDQGLAVPLVNDRTTQEIRRKLLEWSPTPKPLQAQRFVQNCLRPYERNWEMVPWEDMAHTPRCSDPEDQMFINLGVAGNADILVARDISLTGVCKNEIIATNRPATPGFPPTSE